MSNIPIDTPSSDIPPSDVDNKFLYVKFFAPSRTSSPNPTDYELQMSSTQKDQPEEEPLSMDVSSIASSSRSKRRRADKEMDAFIETQNRKIDTLKEILTPAVKQQDELSVFF